jgi:phosphatidylserine/phosphatidylglycerophosphate/cardiolipin synthase-like enzyme
MKKLIYLTLAILFTSLNADEIYFSPSQDCKTQLIKRINNSKQEINFAIYSFTDLDILNALKEAKSRNVKINCVFDYTQSKGTYSLTKELESNFNCKSKKGKGRGVMHHKIAVFDKEEIMSGSFNWTKNATENNYENCIFIKDKEVVEKSLKHLSSL